MSGHFESFGKYVLLEKLATGGMAEVFLGRGTGAGGIGKFFAIKRILPQYADSPEFIDMFKDEAKIAINLSHSNIVSIHEFGIEKGQFFLVMDYVEGRNMRQILNKMKKSGLTFSMDQIVYMIKEVSAGLDHAHRCIDGSTGKPLNITHRDMSPQNVMVSFEGEVKVVDFGIAKAESQIETTRAGTLKGKFGYMSPEQADGQPVDLRTDIFSLGIVIWELLANDRLFVANNEANTLRKIRDCQVPSLRKINPNIHNELERIVQKALARDRNLRYQTAAALHRDLNRFLNRQYPDFSPQDFAVFIKSVFADEILGLRKRLVEYSKVNLSVSLNIPTNTGIVPMESTDTSSLVTTEGGVVTEPGGEIESMNTSRQEATSPTLGVTDVSEPEVTKTEPTPATSVATPIAKPRETTGILSEAALTAELQNQRDDEAKALAKADINANLKSFKARNVKREPVEAEVFTSPSIRQDSGENSIIADDARLGRRPRSATGGPTGFATLMVLLVFGVSVYIYLCKFYPALMEPALKHTYTFAPGFHDMILGPNRFPATHIPTPGPTGGTSPPDWLLENASALIVSSNPSGAEIWLNGINTKTLTPQTITVPPSGTLSLMLRKRGYKDYTRDDVDRETLGIKLDANLEKMFVGFLEIEIFPPQEAIVNVNGRQITMFRTMTTEITVPADRPIKVRAETRNGNSFEEVIVKVPLDKKRTVKLNPRKSSRLPSNAPN